MYRAPLRLELLIGGKNNQGRQFRFFLWGGGGGKDGLASEASLVSMGLAGREGVCKSPSRKSFDFELFYVLFEATCEQSISAKIRYKN